MQVLSTILYILLFILFLSVLIIIHELGHLAAAKAFKVYCLEYSVGMGPLIFKKKRKNGETQFSLRAIPFGGYVSMYGEGVELPEGVEVPPSRSLNGVKWWKRAIIFLAGVTMNALLALVFFFISNCIPQQKMTYVNQIGVNTSSPAYVAGLRSEDIVKFDEWQYYDGVSNVQKTFYVVDNQTTLNGDTTKEYASCMNFAALSSFKHIDFSEFMFIYETDNTASLGDAYIAKYSNGSSFKFLIEKHENHAETIKPETNKEGFWVIDGINTHIADRYSDASNKVTLTSIERLDIDSVAIPNFNKYVTPAFNNATLHVTKRVPGEDKTMVDGDTVSFEITQKEGVIDSFGISLFTYIHKYTFGQAVANTFIDFGNSSVTLIKGIGDLITKPNTWQNVGGIIAVGFETTSILQNYGFGQFLYVWGFISVNLAIFNLLPFPGLDGWQLLVLGVETITRKKIPEKVKNIVSLIGIGLLLILMGVIVVKDLMFYVFRV